MKTRVFFIWLMVACCLPIQAQTSEDDYFPFAQRGKIWEIQVGGFKENLYCNRIDGDTLIDGETWMKVYNYIAWPQSNYSYYAAVRDVGKKVYAIAKGSDRPRLLYDFGMKVGDKVRCGVEGNSFYCLLENNEQPDSLFGFKYVAYLRLERIDTIETHGLQLRRLTLTLLDPYQWRLSENIVWLEGVGSFLSPFLPWIPVIPRDALMLVKSCLIGQTYIANNGDFYQNDEANAINQNNYGGNRSGFIYDVSGRRATSPPSQGIYIRNGKKYVVK